MGGLEWWVTGIGGGALGLILGSFCTVLCWRLPRSESVLFPASHCTACSTPIRWSDNLPLISYLRLRGRCRSCGAGISARYPLIELVCGLWGAGMAWRAWTPDDWCWIRFLVWGTMGVGLVAVTVIDYEHRIVPDELSLALATLGLVGAVSHGAGGLLMNPSGGIGCWVAAPWRAILLSVAGGLTGAGMLAAIGSIGEKIFRQEAMGGGDMKLAGALGTFTGPAGILLVIFLASLLGGLIALGLLAAGRIRRREYLAFGPYLCVAGAGMAVWGGLVKGWLAGLWGWSW